MSWSRSCAVAGRSDGGAEGALDPQPRKASRDSPHQRTAELAGCRPRTRAELEGQCFSNGLSVVGIRPVHRQRRMHRKGADRERHAPHGLVLDWIRPLTVVGFFSNPIRRHAASMGARHICHATGITFVIIERYPKMDGARRHARHRSGHVLMPQHRPCPRVFVDCAVEATPDFSVPDDGRRDLSTGSQELTARDRPIERGDSVEASDRRRGLAFARPDSTRKGAPTIEKSVDSLPDIDDLGCRKERLGDVEKALLGVAVQLLVRQHAGNVGVRRRRTQSTGVVRTLRPFPPLAAQQLHCGACTDHLPGLHRQ